MIDTIRILFNLENYLKGNDLSDLSLDSKFKLVQQKSEISFKSCFECIQDLKSYDCLKKNDTIISYSKQIYDTIRIHVSSLQISIEFSLCKLYFGNNLNNFANNDQLIDALEKFKSIMDKELIFECDIRFFHITRLDISYNYYVKNDLKISDIENNFFHNTKKKIFSVSNEVNQETINFMSKDLRNRFLIYDKKLELQSILKKIDIKETEKREYYQKLINSLENKEVIRFEKRKKIKDKIKLYNLLQYFDFEACKKEVIKELKKLKLKENNSKLDIYNYIKLQKKVKFSESELFFYFLYRENNFKFANYYDKYLQKKYDRQNIKNIFDSIDKIIKKLSTENKESKKINEIIQEIELNNA